MSYRDARRGAAISGALLLGIPLMEVLLGFGAAGPTHFIVGSFGLVLLAAAWPNRLL
jgi:hypothetical protein